MSKDYSTIAKRLNLIARLAHDAPLDEETQEAIGREAHTALSELNALDAHAGKEVAGHEEAATLLRA